MGKISTLLGGVALIAAGYGICYFTTDNNVQKPSGIAELVKIQQVFVQQTVEEKYRDVKTAIAEKPQQYEGIVEDMHTISAEQLYQLHRTDVQPTGIGAINNPHRFTTAVLPETTIVNGQKIGFSKPYLIDLEDKIGKDIKDGCYTGNVSDNLKGAFYGVKAYAQQKWQLIK